MPDRLQRAFNSTYEGLYLSHIAFPLGGIGAGMICLEGSGTLSHFSLRNAPNVFHEPLVFGALKLQGGGQAARMLEGPVAEWKIFGLQGAGNGGGNHIHGFPRFDVATFNSRFPFATVDLVDAAIPLRCNLTGWSPFIPGMADDSSLPFAVLEYGFQNPTQETVEALFSFHTANCMATSVAGASVSVIDSGFVLRQAGSDENPTDEGALAVICLDADASIDCSWFRGGWFDTRTIVWRHIEAGDLVNNPPLTDGDPSPGGSVYVPFSLTSCESKHVTILMTWHVPKTELRTGQELDGQVNDGKWVEQGDTHVPWYTGRFACVEELVEYGQRNLSRLRNESSRFRDCFYDTTLPPVVVEAVAANLSILKSPTILRQAGGQLWCWEGSSDTAGCCAGSCTHVWNYAQALSYLFPDLERSLRHSEFYESQNEEGYQVFRTALPIRQQRHISHAAADGQLGGIMKVYENGKSVEISTGFASFGLGCVRVWTIALKHGIRRNSGCLLSRIITLTTSNSGVQMLCVQASTWVRCEPRP